MAGVITERDIRELEQYPNATKDEKVRLQVLASVGIGDSAEQDAQMLVEAGADGIIIDVLHGATQGSIELTRILRRMLPKKVPIIVGNVATRTQTRKLIDAGANVVKVGWCPGGFCTTRIVTGTSAAQLTAVMECSAEAYGTGATIIADGGITKPADAVLAFYGGAAAIMIGTMFVGTEESPGPLYFDETDAGYKIGRGSASSSAAEDFARASGKDE
ncbi:MAG: IMP dehydrogenase [Patescibacteria group bacterium]|nr:IMP dehydrogenase [Patescibacteria group bacterium]